MKVCFTGHRPDKLGGYDLNSPKNLAIKEAIKAEVIQIVEDYRGHEITFIFGGALGFDQIAFDVCFELKMSKFPFIQLEIAVPFRFQYLKWIEPSCRKYFNQLSVADKITYVDLIPQYQVRGILPDKYHPAKMQKRNEYMVDISDIVIGGWNGDRKGGTFNCLRYAWKEKKVVITIDLKYEEGNHE